MAKRNLPQIKIKYDWHLYPIFKKLHEADAAYKETKFPTEDQVEKKVRAYRQSWAPFESRILTAMCDILELDFSQNIIDVYIAGPSPSFSDPLVINSEVTADRFVDVLTHELLHRLLTCNAKELNVAKIWNEMFPGKDRRVRNHILVHAVHKYIYLEVLKEPSRLTRDINKTTGSSYNESWRIVEDKGYKEIIDEFKKHYVK